MRKPYLFALGIMTMLLLSVSGSAQTRKHDVVINLGPSSGYGYPSPFRPENGRIPAFNLSADFSLNTLLSCGVYAAYTYSFYRFPDQIIPGLKYKDVWKGWDMGVRSSFHFSSLIMDNEKTDLYITAFFGYTILSLEYDKRNIHRTRFNYDLHDINAGNIAGFRYHLTRIVGLYAEAGLSRKFFMSAGASVNISSK